MTTESTRCPVEHFDHHSPSVPDDPYGIFDAMRSQCPMNYSDQYGGFWTIVGYDEVFEASRDDDLFSSQQTVAVPASPFPVPFIPIQTDPPLTGKFRAITQKDFGPAKVEELRLTMRTKIHEMIDSFIEAGECDIVNDLTTPVPAWMIVRVLGLNEERHPDWARWVHTMIHDRTSDPDLVATASMELMGEIQQAMAQRRESGDLGDDVFGHILGGSVDGQPLDDLQIMMYTIMMVFAGMDTTSGLAGNAIMRMIERPELRQMLIDDPDLLRDATEEFLRHSSPVLGLGRTITADTEFGGQQVKAGDKALLMWSAANRDPEVFEDPDTIDFHRANKRHMAFGVGQHRCIGSHLARVMFQEVITAILQRLPDFELNGEAKRFDDAGEIHAYRYLPIKFTPGPRAS